MYGPLGQRVAAPGIHVRAPGCVLRETSKGPECDCNQQYGKNRNGTALPALFSFPGKKRQKDQSQDCQRGTDEEKRGLERWGQQRQQSVEPQEKVIGLRRSLDD